MLLTISFAGEIPFKSHLVDFRLLQASAVYVEDINKDGYQDLITTAAGNKGEVSWWENDGKQNFTKHLLSNNFTSARSVVVPDQRKPGNRLHRPQ